MNDAKLNQIQQAVKAETLTDRSKVLAVINTWAQFKAEILDEIKKRPMGSFHQREDVSDAIDRVKMMNIWPWGGALESILEHVGTATILEHWNRCLNFAREELKKLETKAA
jgi:nucleotidyltransferase/DNA polymerase involved in DNA repair